MKPAKWFIIITAIYLIIYYSHAFLLQKTVFGDGIFYYSWVRSIVVDRDIDFTNDYAQFAVTAPVTPINVLGNKHPVGAPLFWLPWYAQAHTFLRDSGFELPYQLFVGILSVLAAITGLVLLYRFLTEHFSNSASLLSIMSIAGASNLLFYGAVDPVNSLAVSFFAASVFLSFLFSKNSSPLLTGCALGFCALVRPQDAIFGILVIPSLKRSHLLRLKYIVLVIVGAILVFSPQLLAWYVLYGSAWTSPYLTNGESFSFWPTHLVDVLFSSVNGLFLWTPITLMALMGFMFWKDTRRFWFIAVFILAVLIISSWSTWSQGASYSGRMFVSMLPLLAFGLSALYSKLDRAGLHITSIILTIIAPLCIINALLIVRFLLQS